MRRSGILRYVALAVVTACAGTAVDPPRHRARPGDAIADPRPTRIVVHATVGSTALRAALEEALPKSGDGTFPMLGSQRKFVWQRDPIGLRFAQGRIAVDLHVVA